MVGPTVDRGAIVYEDIDSVDDLPRGWTDRQEAGHYRLQRRQDDAYFAYVVGPHSWKRFLFPPRAVMATADRTNDGWLMRTPEPEDARFAFLGVRACEIAAIEVQDRTFLHGPYAAELQRQFARVPPRKQPSSREEDATVSDASNQPQTRTIKVEALARVEGEGGLYVRMTGDRIDDVQLTIYEPPRFFEAFLRGRPLEDVPDVTARICGNCPIAYQMSSVHALEQALGVTISHEIRRMRRLLYCGEWIESHALHMHLLHAPDFFGVDSGIDLVAHFPDEVKRGLRLKKHGNEQLEILGGRPIHPVNVAVGGFYRAPKKDDLQRLIPDFEWGLEATVETVRWVAGFDFPDFERSYLMFALSHPDEYAMNEGDIASSDGTSIPVNQFEQTFEERHAAHSTALHSVRIADDACYYVGPLARVNLNFDRLSERAQRVAEEIRFEVPCQNPQQAIIARGLEVVHVYEEALEILKDYSPFQPPRMEYESAAGEGVAATEAPLGLLYHRYAIDDSGHVTFAKIVPPTSQNQRQIEDDLRELLSTVLNESERTTGMACERLIRSYDPCISCSTHFLKLSIERSST